MTALGEEYSQRNRPSMQRTWIGYFVLILGFTIMKFVGAQPIRATFSSYHENTDTGKDTTMPGDTSFNNYFEQPTGTTYALQLWIQPSTEGPSIYFFSPKAPETSRRMGLLVAYGQSFCRGAAMLGNKKFLSISTGPPEMQVHNLNFDTVTNFYAQTSWTFDSSITGTWSIKTEPMFNNYVYYIDGSAFPTNYLYKWDSTKTARDPGPGIFLASEFCRSWQFLGDFLWIYCRKQTDMTYVQRSTFTVVKTLTGPRNPRDSIFDNENGQVLFAVYYDSPWGVARLEIGATAYVQTHAIPAVPGQGFSDRSPIIMMGKTGYLGLIRNEAPNQPFRIYSKANMIEISTLYYQPRNFPAYMVDTQVVGASTHPGKYEVDFGLQVDVAGVFNFQSWKIRIDSCTTRSGLICTACPASYYIDRPDYLDNSCILEKTGHDSPVSTIIPCADLNCLHCGNDYKICTKCATNPVKPYLFESRCISLPEAPPRFGLNPVPNEIVPCLDANCQNCQANFQICTTCDPVHGFYVDQTGRCVTDSSTAVKVVSVFYDWRQQTATVVFDSDISLSRSVELLNFTVMDVNTSREYTCEQLDCVKQVQSRGVSVKFEATINFTKGEIALSLSPGVNISRANDSRLFTDYPVKLQTEMTMISNRSLEIPEIPSTTITTTVRSMQIPSTLFFAVVHPSLALLFEETFTKVTVIGFYSSPPMQVLDEAILRFKDITIVPFEIPNLFAFLLNPDNCTPIPMMTRYEYDCEFLENFGVDLTIFLFIFVFALLLKGSLVIARACNRTKLKQSQVSTSDAGETAQQNTETESRVTLVQALDWLDRHFGFMLLWIKVEGKQAEYLVFAFQDFWSNDGSKNRILSMTAATICLLHVFISVWGTQRLILFITSLYHLRFSNKVNPSLNLSISQLLHNSVLKLENSKAPNLHSSGIVVNSKLFEKEKPKASSVLRRPISLSRSTNNKKMELTSNKSLQTSWFYPLRFWFDQEKTPTSLSQLRSPWLSICKNVATALCVITLPSEPKIQCMSGIAVELLWFLFIWNHSLKTHSLHILTERALAAGAILFVVGKLVSHSVAPDFLQETLAPWMLTIILVMMLVTALVTILSVAIWAYSKLTANKIIEDLSPPDPETIKSSEPSSKELTVTKGWRGIRVKRETGEKQPSTKQDAKQKREDGLLQEWPSLHPLDPNRIKKTTKPIGTSMVIKLSKFKPFKSSRK